MIFRPSPAVFYLGMSGIGVLDGDRGNKLLVPGECAVLDPLPVLGLRVRRPQPRGVIPRSRDEGVVGAQALGVPDDGQTADVAGVALQDGRVAVKVL